jgi:signal transduction histidine kinase
VYTNLGPGKYRFHVIAANDDGVWNEAGATLDFVIPPTFMQTKAFLALCGVAAAGALWLLLTWRHRRVAVAIRARFDATLAERTRIAQELHDTLLQGFSSVALQVHAARRMLGTQPQQAAEVLAQAAAVADATLREARHAVWEMRAPELEELDLPGALSAAAYDAVGSAPTVLTVTLPGARERRLLASRAMLDSHQSEYLVD